MLASSDIAFVQMSAASMTAGTHLRIYGITYNLRSTCDVIHDPLLVLAHKICHVVSPMMLQHCHIDYYTGKGEYMLLQNHA